MPRRKKGTKEKFGKALRYIPVWAAAAVLLLGIIFSVLDSQNLLTYENITVLLGLSDGPLVEQTENDENLYVHFIDVGQGDSALIQAEGYNILIDCGEAEYSSKVKNYLSQNGVSKLDCTIVTHPHSDHMGGMSELIKEIKTEKIIMPDIPERITPTTSCYTKLLMAIKDSKLKITPAEAGKQYLFGDNLKLNILAPINDTDDSINNYSVVIKITYKNSSFLFTGDAEKTEENDILSQKYDISSDVLKVAHHGSNTSSSDPYLESINPEYCIISCGAGNKYGHPNKKTIGRIKKYTNQIYRTDVYGTIVCITDGNGYDFVFEKGD